MEQKRDDEGNFAENPTPRDVINAFDAVRGPAATTSEIAAVCDCHRATARRRLDGLAEANRVRTKHIGNNTLWWLV
jgi:DNA-binding IclR family transcriptional regulator